MLKLKSPVRASELILPLVKRGYPGCRQESRTRIPAALVLLNESGCFHVFALKVEGTGERGQDFDRDHGLEISDSGDLNEARQEYEKITLFITGRLADGDLYVKAFSMLGKIAEEQGDKARASQNYRKFLDLWKDADPGIPEVEDAKKRLAGLTGS